ncbi:MAG: TetR/AcrR family transcriptional regulator [Gammaproteobacteria bacterium]|nr:TetR/AcrR family transcriptional regulator [Gammaproteobacteria bacterium]
MHRIILGKSVEATSINQVVNRTGVNKYSIYNEFESKEKLFIACIDYFLLNHCFVEKILSKQPLQLKNIEAYFEYKVRSLYS